MFKQLNVYHRTLRRSWHVKFLVLLLSIMLSISFLFPNMVPWGTKEKIPKSAVRLLRTKKDLLDIDISKELENQNWATMGIDKSIKEYNYTERLQPGYIPNINIDYVRKLKKHKAKEQAKLRSKGKKKWQISDKEKLNELNEAIDLGFDSAINCDDIEYNNTIESFKSPIELKVDLKSLRKQMVETDSVFAKDYTTGEEKDMTEEHILNKRWYAFGSASVWLESENCYVTYTRAYYSRRETKTAPYISIIYAQAYDKDWNELHGKRIFFRDVDIPQLVKDEIYQLEQEMQTNLDKCIEFDKDDTLKIQSCKSDMKEINMPIQTKIDQLYNRYSITYPTALDIPIFMAHLYNGPEDPHVVSRKDNEGEEPIIIFNMHFFKGRRVHTFMPHRKNFNLIDLDIDDQQLKKMEKNWAPFIVPGTQKSNNKSPGYINFVYDFSPLEILRCSLLTGHCKFLFKASTLGLDSKGTGLVRGGTQFVPLPDIIPQVEGKNMWLGFTKSHVNACGCGDRFYRPALSVLIEENGIYHLELVAPNIDFIEGALSWSLKDSKCGGYNIISPSSIANWFVMGQDPHTKKFEDYLVLTISEADAISRVTYFRGILNYILDIYKTSAVYENFELKQDSKYMIEKSSQCLDEQLKSYCKAYGKTH